MKLVREHINEKFTEDSDPVEDLGLGTYQQILKWLKEIYPKDNINKNTALVYCVKHGKTKWVKFLIASGDIDVNMWEGYPLTTAASYGHTEIVKLLLDAGANIHFLEDRAFRWAAELGKTEAVKILLDAGANVHALSNYALRKAVENEHTDVVKIIRDHIAKEKEAKKVKKSLNEKFVEDSDPLEDLGLTEKYLKKRIFYLLGDIFLKDKDKKEAITEININYIPKLDEHSIVISFSIYKIKDTEVEEYIKNIIEELGIKGLFYNIYIDDEIKYEERVELFIHKKYQKLFRERYYSTTYTPAWPHVLHYEKGLERYMNLVNNS